MRVLMTGANGFTGRYVAARLATDGYEVHGMVHGTPDDLPTGMTAAHGVDLSDPAGLKALVNEVRPEAVIHLAAIAFVAHGNASEMYATNLLGSRNLLEALAGAAHAPGAVLLASSANIYGNARGGRLSEATPPAPANDYGVSKIAMEYLAATYAERLPIIITRPFNYTGVGQAANFLIPKIIDHARRRAPVLELGNIDVERDFSDVRMVADAYAQLIATPAAIGRTLNVCSGEAVTLRAVIDLVERLSGHRFDVQINPAFVRANEVKTLCGDRSALEGVIGAVQAHPLEDTLRWMLDA